MSAIKLILLATINIRLFLGQAEGQREAKFLNPQKDTKVVNLASVQMRNIKEDYCIGICTLKDDCHSVNYHADDQHCIMITDEIPEDAQSQSHLVGAKGWKYFKKTPVKKVCNA